MIRLGWPDIFTDASALDFHALVALWPHTISGKLQPIGASVFGDLYFHRPNGSVERLDVLEGGVHFVASTSTEFGRLMNSPEWQSSNLLTEGVALLQERGIARELGQFLLLHRTLCFQARSIGRASCRWIPLFGTLFVLKP
jgi:hypothetical protein